MKQFNRICLMVNLPLVPLFVHMQNWKFAAFSFCVFIWCCVDSVVYVLEEKR